MGEERRGEGRKTARVERKRGRGIERRGGEKRGAAPQRDGGHKQKDLPVLNV